MTFRTLFLTGASLALVACGNNAADVKEATSEISVAAKAEMAMKGIALSLPQFWMHSRRKLKHATRPVIHRGHLNFLVSPPA